MSKNNKILFVDLEITCDVKNKPFKEREIIQIGIVEIDTINLEVLRSDEWLVKPKTSAITEYCTELTGITQNDVDSSPNLGKVGKSIRHIYGSVNKFWYSWGRDNLFTDLECQRNKVPMIFSPDHVNLSESYRCYKGHDCNISLKNALNEMGIKPYGKEHKAVDDAMNTALLWIKMAKTFRA